MTQGIEHFWQGLGMAAMLIGVAVYLWVLRQD